MPPGDLRGHRSFDGWTLDWASSTLRAYKVRGRGAVAGVTRIDGCPGELLGPCKTPADTKAFASNEPRVETSPRRAFFLPRRSPLTRGWGRAAGEKECQGRESTEASARCLIASADGSRMGRKNHKMPEWGLT